MAPGNFYTSQLSIGELISEFREFKLSALQDGFKYPLIIKDEYVEKLDFIVDVFPNDVISGSLALNLLGLLSRKHQDIDIVIDDKNRYPSYLQGDYDDEFSTPNRLGIREFKWKKNILTRERKFEVDLFENKDASFIVYDYKRNKIKIHNPVEIMQHKLAIIQNKLVESHTKRKHNEDLTQIFGLAPWQLVLKGHFKM